MPNTMMGYGGVQPQRAVTPAMPIRQDYAGPLPQGGGGLGRGVPLPPKLGGGMNYIGGSPNFDESIGAYRNPPAPPTLGITPIRGPYDAPPTFGVTPTQTPDQMQALRNAHLAQQQAQLLMAQQQAQLSAPLAYRQAVAQQQYIPPNAGIAALPMNPAMMQRLSTIASLAGGVRR